jgi:transposase InsO family protein
MLLFALAGWINRHQQAAIDYLREENRVLREQLGTKRLRLTDDQRRRLAAKAKALGRKALNKVITIVSPETLLAWHRAPIARKWNYSSRRRTRGRPPVLREINALIVRMARENPGWGYTRIRGALLNLGHRVARSTIADILKKHGIDPAAQRRKGMSWRIFLRAHWHSLAAADFFTVEVWTLHGLVTFYVLIAMALSTRRVCFAGATPNPDTPWMMQVARNLTDCVDGFLLGKRFLMLDRDRKYSDAFRRLLEQAGCEPLRLPPRSPNLNAWAERFVRSIKEECLDRMIFFGERSLRRAIREFVVHYHEERNHQGLGNKLIEPDEAAGRARGAVTCRERLGGMLRYYRRRAA